MQFLDPFVDVTLVSSRRRTVFQQQLLGHTLIDAAACW